MTGKYPSFDTIIHAARYPRRGARICGQRAHAVGAGQCWDRVVWRWPPSAVFAAGPGRTPAPHSSTHSPQDLQANVILHRNQDLPHRESACETTAFPTCSYCESRGINRESHWTTSPGTKVQLIRISRPVAEGHTHPYRASTLDRSASACIIFPIWNKMHPFIGRSSTRTSLDSGGRHSWRVSRTPWSPGSNS